MLFGSCEMYEEKHNVKTHIKLAADCVFLETSDAFSSFVCKMVDIFSYCRVAILLL